MTNIGGEIKITFLSPRLNGLAERDQKVETEKLKWK